MSRRVTLRNSPSCETDNPFFKVIVLPGRLLSLFDIVELAEAQIFPVKLFGIGQPLNDTISVSESFRFFANANAFVSLSDSLQIFDVTNLKNNKKYTIVLSDRVEAPTDEFDAIKTRKTIVVSLRDGITLSD